MEDCGRWLKMKLFDLEIESWMVISVVTLSFVGMCCVKSIESWSVGFCEV